MSAEQAIIVSWFVGQIWQVCLHCNKFSDYDLYWTRLWGCVHIDMSTSMGLGFHLWPVYGL